MLTSLTGKVATLTTHGLIRLESYGVVDYPVSGLLCHLDQQKGHCFELFKILQDPSQHVPLGHYHTLSDHSGENDAPLRGVNLHPSFNRVLTLLATSGVLPEQRSTPGVLAKR